MNNKPNTEIVMYTTDDGMTKVEATFDNGRRIYSGSKGGVLFSPDIKQFLISKSPFSEKDIKITNSIFSCHSPAYYCYDCDCLVWKK